MRVCPAVQPALDLWPAKELDVARLLALAGAAYNQSARVLIKNQKAEKAERRRTAKRDRSGEDEARHDHSGSRHREAKHDHSGSCHREAKRDHSGSRHRSAKRNHSRSPISVPAVRLLSVPADHQQSEVVPPKARPYGQSQRSQTAQRSPDPSCVPPRRGRTPPPPPPRPALPQPEQQTDQPEWPGSGWWALYREEMPHEDYYKLSPTQKTSRRRRFLKALAAKEEEESAKPACATGAGVSDEAVSGV